MRYSRSGERHFGRLRRRLRGSMGRLTMQEATSNAALARLMESLSLLHTTQPMSAEEQRTLLRSCNETSAVLMESLRGDWRVGFTMPSIPPNLD